MPIKAWQGRINFAGMDADMWELNSSGVTPSTSESIAYAQDGSVCLQVNRIEGFDITAEYSPKCASYTLDGIPALGTLLDLSPEVQALTGLPGKIIVQEVVLTTAHGSETTLSITMAPFKVCEGATNPDKYGFPADDTQIPDLLAFLLSGIASPTGSAITGATYTLGYRETVEHQGEEGTTSKGGRGAYISGSFTVGACADMSTAPKPTGGTAWDVDAAGTLTGALGEFLTWVFTGRLAAIKKV